MHSLSYPPNLVPFRAKTTMNYTDYGGSAPHPQAVASWRGGGTPSSDSFTTFALFLMLRLPSGIIQQNENIYFNLRGLKGYLMGKQIAGFCIPGTS